MPGFVPSRPRRAGLGWRAAMPEGIVGIVFGRWFEPADHVLEVLDVSIRPVADRHAIRYRLRVENGEGMFVVEQQGSFSLADGTITRMSMVCSGFRPWEATGQT